MAIGPDEQFPPAASHPQPAQDQGQVQYSPYSQPQPGNQAIPYQQPTYQANYQAQPAYQGQPAYQAQVAIVPKNPAISVLLSFFIPGLGSMLNDRVNMGVVILVSYVVGWFLTLVLIGFPIILGVWIWGMIDAYQSAVRWNLARGIAS